MIEPACNAGELEDLLAAGATLRETVRLLNMAERLAHLGHWRLSPDGRELQRSPQANVLLGVASDAVLPARQALRMVEAEDRQTVIRCIAAAIGGGTEISCRAVIRRLDGTRLPVIMQFHRDQLHRNGPMRLFGIIHDITEKVEIENKLIAARDDAEAANRAKSEFLATMSHEIRTPMTGVMGIIELLLGDPSAEERDRYLAAMKHSAELLMTVLDGILDFSKVESGKMELHCCDFDIDALARRTIEMFQNAASKKGLLFDIKVGAGQSPIVYADPVRLQQVLGNLISNAIKFTDHGRISVRLRARPRHGQCQRWRAEVRDTGVGIEAEELSKLFEPFVQTGERRMGGTGLGLTISRKLVEAMNGRTGVKSTPGQGSTFWFEVDLPVGLEQDGVAENAVVAAAVSGGAIHVLIAEDNPINQMLISALVRRLGHRATCVDNGQRAVEAAQATRYDCILMDMQMPEMDGIAATRAIRNGGGPNAGIPIIALSADAAPERRRFYENVGLTSFMTKPINVEALRRAIAPIALSAGGVAGTDKEAIIQPDRLVELREVLGPQKYFMLLRLLANELLERPGDMYRSMAAADMQAMRAQAHSLKGAAGNLGAGGVERAARAVELALPGPELELALRRLEVAAASAHRALVEIIATDIQAERKTA